MITSHFGSSLQLTMGASRCEGAFALILFFKVIPLDGSLEGSCGVGLEINL
jgi:hypothetical protein